MIYVSAGGIGADLDAGQEEVMRSSEAPCWWSCIIRSTAGAGIVIIPHRLKRHRLLRFVQVGAITFARTLSKSNQPTERHNRARSSISPPIWCQTPSTCESSHSIKTRRIIYSLSDLVRVVHTSPGALLLPVAEAQQKDAGTRRIRCTGVWRSTLFSVDVGAASAEDPTFRSRATQWLQARGSWWMS